MSVSSFYILIMFMVVIKIFLIIYFTAAGRYCEWQHITIDKSNDIETFEEYKKTLKLECEPGEPAVLNWTVSFDTPNLVYYQVCYFFSEAHTKQKYCFVSSSSFISCNL